jgi:hypothetical protein
MITAITLENFKGIREPVTLAIRPITLLFGPNSAGKSTLLQGLHYAREVFERHNLDADKTISGGDFVDLGGFATLVHGRDKGRPVRIRIDLTADDSLSDTFSPNYEALRTSSVRRERVDSLTKGLTKAAVEVAIQWSEWEEQPYVAALRVLLQDDLFAEITVDPNMQQRALYVDVKHRILTRLNLEGLQRSLMDDTLVEHVLGDLDVMLFNGEEEPLMGRGDALVECDRPLSLENLEQYSDEPLSATPKSYEDGVVLNQLARAISGLVLGPVQLARKHLMEMRYLGPLRETPSRSYHPPRYPDPARWASGLGAWDVLQADMSGLTEKVSDWLSDEDKLDTGYAVELQEHKRLDLSTQAARKLLSGRAFDEVTDDLRAELVRIPTITQLAIVPKGTSLMLRPQDVGTGISQVLPVVVTALDGEQRLLSVEQPELHLHPRVQAELADLFIEAALGSQHHQVLLETHSELIPLRIMRRIRECFTGAADAGRPPITSADVHVAYVEAHEGATILTTLELAQDGSLLDPWPNGFFEEGFNERFGQ